MNGLGPDERTTTRDDGSPVLRVLMVDDSVTFCRAVGAWLSGETDIVFRSCQEPEAALAIAAEFTPNVIIQDLVMPGVDGLDMIRTYRRTAATEHVPVIVLSGSTSAEQKTTAFLVGADDYVAKGAERHEFLARIRYHGGRFLAMQREGLHRHPTAKGIRAHTARLLVIEPTRVGTAVLRAAFDREPDVVAHFCADDRSALRAADELLPTVIVVGLFSGTYDGFELIQRLRSKRATHDVPIVFYTSTDDPALKARALESGANDYVLRTRDTRDLVARVKRHSSRHVAARQARLAADGSAADDGILKALLVSDDAGLARDVQAMLHSERDVEVTVVEPTLATLGELRTLAPMVVLLDLDARATPGLELLRALRDDPVGEELPVIALSERVDPQAKARAFALGVDDHVERSVDKIELTSRLRHHARAHLGSRQLKRALSSAMDMQRRVEVQSDFIRRTFGRYLSDGVVDAILDDPDGLQLGGEARVVTLMMTDLRGFTAMSEVLPPAKVIEVLNGYFEVMTRVLMAHEATIDEFIGDAIFAIFGAPNAMADHAARAIACAVAMQNAMGEVNAELARKGLPELEMGIGLNTGEVVVGNVGSERRTKFGVVGRHVNLASRVESYTVGGQILASDSTVQAAGPSVVTRGSRLVEPKGIKVSVRIHEVLGMGAPYACSLALEEDEPVTLSEPLAVLAFPFDGKARSPEAVPGTFVALSRTRARANLGSVGLDDNLQLGLLGDDGRTLTDEVFAKVVEVEGTTVELRFTSVGGPARVLLAARRAGQRPRDPA
jgi:adenylate cyclase